MEMKAVLRVTIDLRPINCTCVETIRLYFHRILPQVSKSLFKKIYVIFFIKIATKYKKSISAQNLFY